MSDFKDNLTLAASSLLAQLPKDLDKDTVLLGDSRIFDNNVSRTRAALAEREEIEPYSIVACCNYIARLCSDHVIKEGKLVANSVKIIKSLGFDVDSIKIGNVVAITYLQLPVGRIVFYCNEILCDEIIDFFTSINDTDEEEPMESHVNGEKTSDDPIYSSGGLGKFVTPALQRVMKLFPKSKRGGKTFFTR